mgnify:CR=1 FL=1
MVAITGAAWGAWGLGLRPPEPVVATAPPTPSVVPTAAPTPRPSPLPTTRDVGAEFTAWWDEGFGSLVEVPGDGGTDTLAVLPYDRALTADGITCTMALDGVTCTNEATGHSFHLNRAGVTLK